MVRRDFLPSVALRRRLLLICKKRVSSFEEGRSGLVTLRDILRVIKPVVFFCLHYRVRAGGDPKTLAATLKQDLRPNSGVLVQEWHIWYASIRDATNPTGGTGLTGPL